MEQSSGFMKSMSHQKDLFRGHVSLLLQTLQRCSRSSIVAYLEYLFFIKENRLAACMHMVVATGDWTSIHFQTVKGMIFILNLNPTSLSF